MSTPLPRRPRVAALFGLAVAAACRCAPSEPPPAPAVQVPDAAVIAVPPAPDAAFLPPDPGAAVDGGNSLTRGDWDGPVLVRGRTDVPCAEAADGGGFVVPPAETLARATNGLSTRSDLQRLGDTPAALTSLGAPGCEEAACEDCGRFDPDLDCTRFECEREQRYVTFAEHQPVMARASVGAGVVKPFHEVDEADCWPEKTKAIAACEAARSAKVEACHEEAARVQQAGCDACAREHGCDGGSCDACSDLCETGDEDDCEEKTACEKVLCTRQVADGVTIDEIEWTQPEIAPPPTSWWVIRRDGRPDVRIEEGHLAPGRLVGVVADEGGALRFVSEAAPMDGQSRALRWVARVWRIDAEGRVERGRAWTFPAGCRGELFDAECCSR